MAQLYSLGCGPGKFSICEYDGYRFVSDVFYDGHDHAKMKEHMESLQNMEMRDDDVLLLAYPKSGTHFVREICHMLQEGRVEYISEDFDFPIEYRHTSEVASLESPRTLYTHIWYHMLPKQIKEGKRGKAIAVFRNPKDVVVSFRHFMSNRFEVELPIDIFTNLMVTDQIICNSWYVWRKYLVEGKQKAKQNFKVLPVLFEDLVQNPRDEISTIAKYLGKDVSSDFIKEICKACEISTMRKEKIKRLPKDVEKFFAGRYEAFYRKGTIGDWKTELPTNVNEVMDKWIASQEDDDFAEFPNYKDYYKDA